MFEDAGDRLGIGTWQCRGFCLMEEKTRVCCHMVVCACDIRVECRLDLEQCPKIRIVGMQHIVVHLAAYDHHFHH